MASDSLPTVPQAEGVALKTELSRRINNQQLQDESN
jgi:hypothetical protein